MMFLMGIDFSSHKDSKNISFMQHFLQKKSHNRQNCEIFNEFTAKW